MTMQQNTPAAGLVAQESREPQTAGRGPSMSRRGLWSAAAAALAGAALTTTTARRAKAQTPSIPPTVPADVDPGSLTKRLVDRITFGATAAELARADQLGFQGYLEEQLSLSSADENPDLTARLSAMTWLSATNEALYDQTLINGGLITNELIDATILRAAFSRRQLYERMVEFWSDHFSIDLNGESQVWLKMIDDRSVIRPFALETFPDLLNASARSPAMLTYLDNDASRVNFINENYARELLELHTLGVTGGYTQPDVIEVARALTGWDWWRGNSAPNPEGTFRYQNSRHDQGLKTLSPVFNLSNPTQNFVIAANGGLNDGVTILNILARHPRTANYIATKLCTRFIGENCPTQVISAVADAYFNNPPNRLGDIKSMLRVMLQPNVLSAATPRVKRPFHLFASALRVVLPGVTSISTLSTYRTFLNRAGHLPFQWGPPDGYPDKDLYWSGLQLPRWNYTTNLVTTNTTSGGTTGGINGINVDASVVDAILPTNLTTRDQIVNRLNSLFFAGDLPSDQLTALRNFLPVPPASLTVTQRRDVIGLALSSPAFQFC